MENRFKVCPWGDCPDINHGPISREHEGRFIKQSKPENSMVKNAASMTITGDNLRNHAK